MTTIVLDIVFGILGMMIVAWFSRAREFRADAGAAALAGKGKMIGALQRLQQNTQLVDTEQSVAGDDEDLRRARVLALLSTHPPLESGSRPCRTA